MVLCEGENFVERAPEHKTFPGRGSSGRAQLGNEKWRKNVSKCDAGSLNWDWEGGSRDEARSMITMSDPLHHARLVPPGQALSSGWGPAVDADRRASIGVGVDPPHSDRTHSSPIRPAAPQLLPPATPTPCPANPCRAHYQAEQKWAMKKNNAAPPGPLAPPITAAGTVCECA